MRWRRIPDRRAPGADAIVVLGCGSAPRLKRRVERGVGLYREAAAPLLVLSGGGRGGEPEAVVMRRLALAAGLPQAALVVEPRSRNTWENACESAALLRRRGLRRIVLVSDRAHLLRAGLLFRLAGVEVARWAGVRRRSPVEELGAFLWEIAALPRSLLRASRRPPLQH
jgi:uncharacterized SAM-binding protein YcdF (DUF218 family)